MKTHDIIKAKSKFGLKDLKKTKANYKGLWNKYSYVIDEYDTSDLYDIIYNEIANDYYRWDYHRKALREAFATGKSIRSTLNQVKTWINWKTWDYNASLFDFANTTKNNYATKLYLAHYQAINEAMQEVFYDFVMSEYDNVTNN